MAGTIQEDQKSKEETERRDRLIFELITERFRLEWQRISDLDEKAMGIIGFVGIIYPILGRSSRVKSLD
jgi:hypothetical protein